MSQEGTPDPSKLEPTGDPGQQPEWVLPPEGRSRRHFLRTAVISTAAAAALVGGGAALANTPIGPKLLGSISPVQAHSSPGTCIPLAQGSKGSPNNPNMTLQVASTYAGDFEVGSQLKVVSKVNSSTIQLTTVTGFGTPNNGVIQIFINPGVTDEFPAGSCVYVLVY